MMQNDTDKKNWFRPSYAISFVLFLAATAWILTGDLEQAKRYYSGETASASTPAATAEKTEDGSPRVPAAQDARTNEATGSAEKQTLVRVRTSEAQPRAREVVTLGQTDIIRDAEVTAETSGRIVTLKATKGAWLNKGDEILRLALDDRQARLKEAEARVAFEQKGYEAALKLSKRKFQSEVRLAEELSQLESARANLAAIRLDIARTVIKAPIDGYLDTLPVGPGDYLDNGDAIGTLVHPDPIRVVAQVSENDIAYMRAGMPARARIPGQPFIDGDLRFIARQADRATRTFRVDVWFPNPDHRLRDGQTMELHMPAGTDLAHRVSPAVLTLNDKGQIGVKAVGRDQRVDFYPVIILDDSTEGIWLGGLPDRVTIITVGQEYVTEGQKVLPQPEQPLVDADGAQQGTAAGDAS